jgi:monooxygenase
MEIQHFDVVIVGAGLSGICAGYHLKTNFPKKSFAIFEGRSNIGGTWDLFRYPGVRSDSDMHTLGYSFRPWHERKAIADGADILKYVKETAADFQLDQKIHFNHRVKAMRWDSGSGLWTLEVEVPGAECLQKYTCNFLHMCTGYYSYEEGYDPPFEGRENFKGQILHPQFWPEKLDYKDKKIVVIGSGATAVTLIPSMAPTAKHIVMLQRSPTYIAAVQSEDKCAIRLHKWLPDKVAHFIIKQKNLLIGVLFFLYASWKPHRIKALLLKAVQTALGPDYDVKKHFTPKYNPWDQRLCAVPDGDLFNVIRRGKASVVTDHIDYFTEAGIKLKSGQSLDADIIVTATGLKMELMSKVDVSVDGRRIKWGETIAYKGFMYSGVPNLISSFGYTTASWTLKADLINVYMCRLLRFMDKNGYSSAMPDATGVKVADGSLSHLTSGYVMRARDEMPKQGINAPWISSENYYSDIFTMRYSRVDDGAMKFGRVAVDCLKSNVLSFAK